MIEIHKIPFKDIEECGMSLKDKDNSWSLKNHAEFKKADIAINAAMFSNGNPKTDPYYYWNIVDMVIDGKFNRGGNYSNKGLAFGKPFAGISAYPSTTENCINKPVDFVAGAPTLIINGVINMDMKGLTSAFATNLTNRTAIGIDGSNIYIATTRAGHYTLKQVAQALVNAGCKNAIDFDGGVSTAFYKKKPSVGIDYYTQNRNITSAFYIRLKKATATVPTPPVITKPVVSTPIISADSPLVIFDAGHNSLNRSNRSLDGTFVEADFTLELVNLIIPHVNRCKIRTKFVESVNANQAAELNDLVKQIDASGGDVMVSIHTDAYSKPLVSGQTIYCYRLQGEGMKLAQAIHDTTIPESGMYDMGIKDENNSIRVIFAPKMPCVLIECGFHTNLDDLTRLKSKVWKEKEAILIAKGIVSYFKKEWIPEPATYNYKVCTEYLADEVEAAKVQNILLAKGYDSTVMKEAIK